MEAAWLADRSLLRHLLEQQPAWTNQQLADEVGRSLTWVKKWKKRLRKAPTEAEQSLFSQSRARHHPPEKTSQPVVEAILMIRDQPPDELQRTPGPRAIIYYLQQQAALVTAGQHEQSFNVTEPILWGDLPPIARPLVKWSSEVHRVEDLPRMLRRAITHALAPPRGPVFLSLPGDILNAEADLDLGAPTRVAPRMRADAQAIEEAAALLAASERPLILAGWDAGASGAHGLKSRQGLAAALSFAPRRQADPPGVLEDRRAHRPRCRHPRARSPPPVAPLLRDPPAVGRSRPAQRPDPAGARQRGHDRDLHARFAGSRAPGLPEGASEGVSRRRLNGPPTLVL